MSQIILQLIGRIMQRAVLRGHCFLVYSTFFYFYMFFLSELIVTCVGSFEDIYELKHSTKVLSTADSMLQLLLDFVPHFKI
jgi:hypothetical protein